MKKNFIIFISLLLLTKNLFSDSDYEMGEIIYYNDSPFMNEITCSLPDCKIENDIIPPYDETSITYNKKGTLNTKEPYLLVKQITAMYVPQDNYTITLKDIPEDLTLETDEDGELEEAGDFQKY